MHLYINIQYTAQFRTNTKTIFINCAGAGKHTMLLTRYNNIAYWSSQTSPEFLFQKEKNGETSL